MLIPIRILLCFPFPLIFSLSSLVLFLYLRLYLNQKYRHCCVIDFSRCALSFSSFSMLVAVGSIAHIVLRYTPCVLIVLGSFIMKGHWIFLKVLFLI